MKTETTAEAPSERWICVYCGSRDGGAASTVVDLTVDPPRVLREGAVPVEGLGGGVS